jgi:hypothetical protein
VWKGQPVNALEVRLKVAQCARKAMRGEALAFREAMKKKQWDVASISLLSAITLRNMSLRKSKP